jgi:hypothetical protein
MTSWTLLLDFAVTRRQPVEVVIADAYWSFAPVTHGGVAVFVQRLKRDVVCARLKAYADAIRADRVEVAC